LSAYPYIVGLWVAVGIVWLISAFASKRATRTQSVGRRVAHVAFMGLAFSLLFKENLGIGPLAWRAVPESSALQWAGFVLTAPGLAFAVWARLLLGGNWSASVTIKHDHRLVRTGPYAIVRHPIYTGGLLGMLGTALVVGEVRGFLAVALAFIGWRSKSRVEEAFMIEQFGAEYARYQREVKALIPFVY
jgi:protein-S-isoprenylcysteine O-methyltransferase Ste14